MVATAEIFFFFLVRTLSFHNQNPIWNNFIQPINLEAWRLVWKVGSVVGGGGIMTRYFLVRNIYSTI